MSSIWCDPVVVARSMMIVDDHPAFRHMAARLMAGFGYSVIGEAADGAGAIERARRLRPDILLLDVQLPDLDGFAVVAELAGTGIDIVLVSTRDAADYGPQLETCDCRGFINKRELTLEALEALVGPAA